MNIGYPCINRSIGCTANHTFRLKSFSPERLQRAVSDNLDCLEKILRFNAARGLLFFRISSDLVPFASHPVCTVPWQRIFQTRFAAIGSLVRKYRMRISMHPDQFVLLNAPDERIMTQSVRELAYHAEALRLLGLGVNAKIQIHVGGVYGDKEKSIARFIAAYGALDRTIRQRLVIENDDRLYCAADCLRIASETGVPVLFDAFHHRLNNRGEPVAGALRSCCKTWKKKDGIPMVDYSSQMNGGRRGAHAQTINMKDFGRFHALTAGIDFDCMLEIKDKEISAIKALRIIKSVHRAR